MGQRKALSPAGTQPDRRSDLFHSSSRAMRDLILNTTKAEPGLGQPNYANEQLKRAKNTTRSESSQYHFRISSSSPKNRVCERGVWRKKISALPGVTGPSR